MVIKRWKSAVNGVSRSFSRDELNACTNRVLFQECDTSVRQRTLDVSEMELSKGIRLSCKLSRAIVDDSQLVEDRVVLPNSQKDVSCSLVASCPHAARRCCSRLAATRRRSSIDSSTSTRWEQVRWIGGARA
eukprot:768513-Hanusia_phi.AAC.5